jgi:hypothetical protein
MRLVQLKKGLVRRVAVVEEPHVRILDGCTSVYELASLALRTGSKLSDEAQKRFTPERLDYHVVYRGTSEWKMLPPIDHPEEPARCMISGTGLTHLGSARDRQSMHAVASDEMTDSMKMFHWGRDSELCRRRWRRGGDCRNLPGWPRRNAASRRDGGR